MKWRIQKCRFETEMDEELRAHFERRIQENIANGMSPDQARRAATLQFGGIDQIKESCREGNRWVWLEQLARDARIGLRILRKSPGYAAAAALTLALGIGATTAVFTIANSLLLKPLPFPKSNRVVSLWEGKGTDEYSQTPMAPTQFIDLRPRLKSFKVLAGWNSIGINFASKEATPERFQGAAVTEDFFKVVETYPEIGAGFSSSNFQPGQDDAVLIGNGIWRERFARNPDVIGKKVTINGRERVIAGVMPTGFQSPGKAQFWLPRVFNEHEQRDRNYKALLVLGRLQDGITVDQAGAELETAYAALREQHKEFLGGWRTRLHRILEDATKQYRSALYLLMAAVSAVLLMACINVANLTLARGSRRLGELSVRAALGASRLKLMRQMLIENLVLAGCGAILGLGVAKALLAMLLASAPSTLPRIEQVRMDWWTLVFGIVACIASGLLFGLAPAWTLSQRDPARELKDAGQRSTATVGWLRRGLAVFQVAASVIVLIGTALLLRSFERLIHEDLGFNPDNLMTARIELPAAKYASENRRDLFADQVLNELRATPGLEDAAATTYLPLQGWPHFIMRLESHPDVQVSEAPGVGFQGVSESYVATMGMRMVLGRDLARTDAPDGPRVCLVNETFVRRFIPEGNPIGKRLEIGFNEPPNWMEIVGVVNDARNEALEAEPREQVIAPMRQQDDFFRQNPAMSLVARTATGFNAANAIRQAVWRIDKDQPLAQLRPMDELLVDSRAQRRFTVLVLSLFAATAALLAGIGLFGVMSGDVAARTREFGIRMALGALPSTVTRGALRAGVIILSAGLGSGIFGAWAGARLIRTMLYHTHTFDLTAWFSVFGVLIFAGLAACYWPARRAGKVDPMIALRNE